MRRSNDTIVMTPCSGPVFVFDNRERLGIFALVTQHFAEIKEVTDKTTSIGRLRNIETHAAGKLLFLRFNFTTGDAAGQNMVARPLLPPANGCGQLPRHPALYSLRQYGYDKKVPSSTACTRAASGSLPSTIPVISSPISPSFRPGTLKAAHITNTAPCWPDQAIRHALGQRITAIFIATGQDAANVAESSPAIVFADQTPTTVITFDYHPSLIVGTYGGGTALATQRECLEIMDCYGAGKVGKLAEIIAATYCAASFTIERHPGA